MPKRSRGANAPPPEVTIDSEDFTPALVKIPS